MDKVEKYLSEDKDLLEELEAVGPPATNQALAHQERKISEIQIKSILRSRKSTSDLDKSTTRYSRVLIIFAAVQIVVALFQLLFSAVASEHPWMGIFTLLLCVISTIAVMNSLTKDFKKD